ncbi:DUF2111 domain-containing protein [Methanosalsum natronophilum]|uniref:DUF2111 domain-containing protein n=1 Tax=Methanosalsum natronophilum TaxID=768733 RepID=UPI0021695D88|nr:DUF2111 domain-containing protein [Methanosalsum natronophilum]
MLELPTTMRTKNKKGVRVEKSKIIDSNYTGPVLEEVLVTEKVTRKIPGYGPYKGKAVIVVPIKSSDGNSTIAAIGVVDLLASLDMMSLFDEYPNILEEVEIAKKDFYSCG